MASLDKDDRAQILLSLAKGGGSWLVGKIGWSAAVPVCDWEGVVCDPIDQTVTSLELRGQGVGGPIPSDLGRLETLRTLNLAQNKFHGTIPDDLASLPALELLDLSENDLEGTLPFQSSGALRDFSVADNRLKGTLPVGLLGPSSSLMKLDLSHNHFNGTLPSSWTDAPSLGYLDLSHNRLEGSIPSTMGNLKELRGLFLNDNSLIGTLPVSLSHSDLKLVQLFLEHNALSGTIPAGLAELPRLVDLFVDGNKLTGTVPGDLCKLNLNKEFFTGKYNVSGLNGCNAVACPVNTVSKEGVHPCFECKTHGFNPYLGRNGQCFHLDQKVILDRFYDETNGPMWYGGSGWRMSSVPACSYEGVDCNNAGQVVNITLANFNLQGSLPEEVGYLRHLRNLNLSDNELTGYLPSDLRWPPLESLDISGNKIKGFVPPMLCLTGDINGNGENGDFNCNTIACAKGTWSPTGRATPMDPSGKKTSAHHQCKPCAGASNYIGTKSCTRTSLSLTAYLEDPIVRHDLTLALVTLLVLVAIGGFVCLVRRTRRQARENSGRQGGERFVLSDQGEYDDLSLIPEKDEEEASILEAMKPLETASGDRLDFAAEGEGEDRVAEARRASKALSRGNRSSSAKGKTKKKERIPDGCGDEDSVAASLKASEALSRGQRNFAAKGKKKRKEINKKSRRKEYDDESLLSL